MATIAKDREEKRQEQVVEAFKSWIADHPGASLHEKVRELDLISDLKYYAERRKLK